MSENVLYFNGLNILKDSLSYCVDMLRLTCQMTVDFFELKIVSRELVYKEKLTSWNSTKIDTFYYNYNYCDNDCSFWFGFLANKERTGNKKSLMHPLTTFNFTIEFNPNKVKDCPLLLHILSLSSSWELKQCDFAIDINTNICNICGLDKGRKECLMTYDCGGTDKTYYIGKRDNRVKIYNKTLESNLNYDLTRIEITKYFDNLPLRCVSTYSYNGYVPELYLKEFQLSMEDMNLDGTLLALVYAVTIMDNPLLY